MKATRTPSRASTGRIERSRSLVCLLGQLVVGSVLCGLNDVDVALARPAANGLSAWHDDFEAALREARRRGRPLLVHFYADWCGPCQIMEAQVLHTPAIEQQIRRDFVAVKVDFDRRGDVARRYGVQVLPADLILAPDGRVLARSEGLTGVDGYRRQLAATASRFRRQAPRRGAPSGDRSPPSLARPTDSGDEALLADARTGSPAAVATEPESQTSARPADTRSDGTPAASDTRPREERAVKPHAPRTPVPALPEIDLAWQALNQRAGNGPSEPATARTPRAADTSAEAARPASSDRRPQSRGDSSLPVVPTVSVRPEPTNARTASEETRSDESPRRIGMEGYSPVALYRRREWVRGDPRFAHSFRGITYYLALDDELAAFREDPVRYAPRLQGCDPVVMYDTDRAIPGSVEFAAYFDGELYLFISDETRRRFEEDPLRYTRTRHVRRSRRADAEAATR